MNKALYALAVAVIAVGFVAATTADEKKTVEGKMVCTKCKLKETSDCGNAMVVKEKGKDVTYYLKDKGKGESYHVCSGEKECKATGKIVEKDGKKWVEDSKVEMKK